MAQLISLSRAARLVGVKRTTLQKQIREGELHTFEGELDLSELMKCYPQTDLDRSGMVERADRIIEQAMGRVSTATDKLPDAEVLAVRVTLLSHELGTARARVNRYNKLVARLQDRLDALQAREDSPAIAELRTWLEQEIEAVKETQGLHEEMLATDTFMRLVAAHVELQPSGHDFFLNGSESLLHAGLRSGIQLRYGCTDGSCGRCRARLVHGDVKRVRDFPECLSDEDLQQGWFTLCAHTAMTDLTLHIDEIGGPEDIEPHTLRASVRRVEALPHRMLALYLNPVAPGRLVFLSGQSVQVRLDDAAAVYPVASCPCDETQIELHINLKDDNALSRRLSEGLDGVRELELSGPQGQFVLNAESVHSLIFIAWGDDFAPIKSLVEHALALDMAEQIHIYWVVTGDDRPYMHNLCRAWMDAIENVNYMRLRVDPALLDGDPQEAITEALSDLAEQHYNVRIYDFYIAGPEAITRQCRKYLIARGVPPAQVRIKAD